MGGGVFFGPPGTPTPPLFRGQADRLLLGGRRAEGFFSAASFGDLLRTRDPTFWVGGFLYGGPDRAQGPPRGSPYLLRTPLRAHGFAVRAIMR